MAIRLPPFPRFRSPRGKVDWDHDVEPQKPVSFRPQDRVQPREGRGRYAAEGRCDGRVSLGAVRPGPGEIMSGLDESGGARPGPLVSPVKGEVI